MEGPDAYGTLALASRSSDRGRYRTRPTRTRRSARGARSARRSQRPGSATWPLYRRALHGGRQDSRAGRGGRHRGEEPRQGRSEARGRGVRAADARAEAPGDRGGRQGAGDQQSRQDPVPGRAHVHRGRGDRESPSPDRGPRRRAADRAAGLREDARRQDRARSAAMRARRSGSWSKPTRRSTRGSATSSSAARIWPRGPCRRPTREFDRCLKRRGEALALFLDEEPTFGYFPTVYYYQGRVREQMKIDGFAESYRAVHRRPRRID